MAVVSRKRWRVWLWLAAIVAAVWGLIVWLRRPGGRAGWTPPTGAFASQHFSWSELLSLSPGASPTAAVASGKLTSFGERLVMLARFAEVARDLAGGYQVLCRFKSVEWSGAWSGDPAGPETAYVLATIRVLQPGTTNATALQRACDDAAAQLGVDITSTLAAAPAWDAEVGIRIGPVSKLRAATLVTAGMEVE